VDDLALKVEMMSRNNFMFNKQLRSSYAEGGADNGIMWTMNKDKIREQSIGGNSVGEIGYRTEPKKARRNIGSKS
jgi:hypothetical protein